MDISDISKVASRKRINTDAEKLREKVSRETAKIIKLKVAQDTAYWDLQEKLQQVEGARERLQQNMVDVQMQHEAVSARYQQELRLRPDTLNKLVGTRDMCNVLEEYGERLRRGVTRCRADRAALGVAYSQCGARVRRLAAAAGLARRDAHQQRDAARCAHEQRDVDARRLADALEHLGAARAHCDHLTTQRRDLAARLERAAADAERKDEASAAMQDDVARLMREFDAQNAEMKQIIADKDMELKAAATAVAALREQVERLLAELAELRRVRDQLTEAENTIDSLKKEETTHAESIRNLQKLINDKNQHEQILEAEISSLKQHVCKLEAEKVEVSEQLKEAARSCSAQASAIDELSRGTQALQRSLADAEAALAAQREADARKIEELSAAGDTKDRELLANTGTIARLMAELKSETDAHARANAALVTARRHHDTERDAAAAREAALTATAARLDAAAQAKEDELRAQMIIIMDMRSEKERLQERIQGMQNTIDNIQKELTGRLQAPKVAEDVGEPPELDASPKSTEARRADDNTYNFLSDGSVDGDALDPREVGRRFEAIARAGARAGARRDARRDTRGASLLPRRPLAAQGSISLSQVKDDLKIKSRSFFKNKRFDSKAKKLK